MYRTIRLHFPELFGWMREVDDCRKKASEYELAAHLTACLMTGVFLHAALRLFAASPLKPIADAIECAGINGQREW